MNDSYAALLDARRCLLSKEMSPIFSTTSEIVCEVGCGHGHFLTAYAAAHPDRVCIGLDLVSERVERARRKRDRAGLANLHFLRAEARLFMETLPAIARISGLFLLFPDPWPKLRHQKHRILQAGFLDLVADRATPGCRLAFRTDYLPYFSDAQSIIRNHPRWRLVQEPWPFEYATVFQQRAASFASLIAVRRSCKSTCSEEETSPGKPVVPQTTTINFEG